MEPKESADLGWVYIAKGKTKYAKRYIPLTERAHNILEKLKAHQGKDVVYGFPAKDGMQLSRHWVSEIPCYAESNEALSGVRDSQHTTYVLHSLG